MFGSGGHIVFSQSNSVLEPLIRTLWGSTICSADVCFLEGKRAAIADRRYNQTKANLLVGRDDVAMPPGVTQSGING